MDLSAYGFRADFDEGNKIVKQEPIFVDGKEYRVSTVDLGLDHSHGGEEPLYFETMIFPQDGWGELYCKRYNNREQAAKAHERLINEINAGKLKIIDGYFEPIQGGESDANS